MRSLPLTLLIATLLAVPATTERQGWIDPLAKGSANTLNVSAGEADNQTAKAPTAPGVTPRSASAER